MSASVPIVYPWLGVPQPYRSGFGVQIGVGRSGPDLSKGLICLCLTWFASWLGRYLALF